ncbi:hypothetical protein PR202_ga25531 [Eleusine coracana subsp. coracana]|uniref:Uncharacterized protein n=1 Tax=Eleusine coracana subsp. coracana TaxID=191504 RepID=A0AAV5DB90_ELECO|nr:hypothetical protein PR202_ga25531 [Eleusine coracana subsp. coracana]
MPTRPRRAAGHCLPLCRLLLLLPVILLLFLLLPTLSVLLRRANSFGRRCLHPAADGLLLRASGPRLSLAIVTLSDEGASRGRSFRGVLAVSARNKRAYAAAHGYDFAVLPHHRRGHSPPAQLEQDTRASRTPPLSPLALLERRANPAIPLERILFSVIGHSDFDESPDLILTEDFNGVNAGMGPNALFSV